MTNKDEELIKKATAMNSENWFRVLAMVKEASTNEAKDRLQIIAKSMYDKENEQDFNSED